MSQPDVDIFWHLQKPGTTALTGVCQKPPAVTVSGDHFTLDKVIFQVNS